MKNLSYAALGLECWPGLSPSPDADLTGCEPEDSVSLEVGAKQSCKMRTHALGHLFLRQAFGDVTYLIPACRKRGKKEKSVVENKLYCGTNPAELAKSLFVLEPNQRDHAQLNGLLTVSFSPWRKGWGSIEREAMAFPTGCPEALDCLHKGKGLLTIGWWGGWWLLFSH